MDDVAKAPREGLDPFEISALVPTFDARMEQYRVASDATRSRLNSRLDIPYGDRPRQRIDLYFPDGGHYGDLPVHLFVHGGYWRAQRKENYAFVADGVVAQGAIAAIVEYSLMPQYRMAELVAEVRTAAAWITAHAHDFGGSAQMLSASGHSAGAHLCSYIVNQGPVEERPRTDHIGPVLLISGIYDLRPIRSSFLQKEISLSEAEAAQWSPLISPTSGATCADILVGEQESQPFHDQARDYVLKLAQIGASAKLSTIPRHDHMSIVRELGHPDSLVGKALARTIDRSRQSATAGNRTIN